MFAPKPIAVAILDASTVSAPPVLAPPVPGELPLEPALLLAAPAVFAAPALVAPPKLEAAPLEPAALLDLPDVPALASAPPVPPAAEPLLP